MDVKTIYVDIDGTICTQFKENYLYTTPYFEKIKIINRLFDEGHKIIYWTARGALFGNVKELRRITKMQLKTWGCKYHKLIMGKPYYDLLIDDKAINDVVFVEGVI